MKGGFAHLGYPNYFKLELTAAKILGVLAMLIPGVPRQAKGFAYSGFDLGSASAPPLLGFLLDHGEAAWVLPAMALSLVLVILSALGLKVRHKI